jgi:hypothetical protein
MPKKIIDPTIDVLILHGLDQDLVTIIERFLESLGISAKTVLQLYSEKKLQDNRVDYQIKNCGMPLVLATFDEEEKYGTKPRTNVISEITRCVKLRKKDTLVLREERNGQLVQLASNEEREIIQIPFRRDALPELFINLVKELKGRKFIVSPKSKLETALDTGGVLNKFLDRMDDIWEEQFDKAADCIDLNDYATENKFQQTLDRFFIEYWKVFDSMIRKKIIGDQLRALCDEALEKASALAAKVWETVYEGKRRVIELSLKDKYQSDERAKEIIDTYLPEVVKQTKQINRIKHPLQNEIISVYREATAKLEEIQKRLKSIK